MLNADQIRAHYNKFEFKIKKGLLAGGIGLALLLAVVIGPQVLYIIAGIAAVGAYVLFPDEIENVLESNKPILYGAAIGFLYGGPIGVLVGAWLGYEFQKRYQQGVSTLNNITDRINQIEPVLHPINFAKGRLNSLWEKARNGFNWLLEDVEITPATIPTQAPASQEAIQPEEAPHSIANEALSLPAPLTFSQTPVEDNTPTGPSTQPRWMQIWDQCVPKRPMTIM